MKFLDFPEVTGVRGQTVATEPSLPRDAAPTSHSHSSLVRLPSASLTRSPTQCLEPVSLVAQKRLWRLSPQRALRWPQQVWRVKWWSLRHLFSALSGPVFLSFGLSLFIWASLLAQLVKNPPAMQETPVWFLGQEDPLERGKDTHCSILGLRCGSAGKESACNAGDLGSIPGLGRSPGEGKGNPLQYSGLENSTDYIVHGVATSQTQLTDFHFIYLIGG